MLDKKVVELINTQVNKEFYSAHLYLDLASYYKDAELNGLSGWYQVQAQGERDHVMLFIQYLQNNGEKITLEAIVKPGRVFEDFRGPLTAGLKYENYVTGSIHDIYGAAYPVKDFRTMQFLDWFVEEQGEEEKNASKLVKCFDLFGHDPKGFYMLDPELAVGVYTAPSLVL